MNADRTETPTQLSQPVLLRPWQISAVSSAGWALMALGTILLNPLNNMPIAFVMSAVQLGFAIVVASIAREGRQRAHAFRDYGLDIERIP